MINTRFSLKPSSEGRYSAHSLSLPAFVPLGIGGLFLVLQFPLALHFAVAIGCLCLRFPGAVNQGIAAIASHPSFQRLGGYRTLGLLLGTLLFLAITANANPAFAQIFDTAEEEVDTIFGEYLDSEIITFLFGLIRVVIWVSAVGFVFFAIYQAQRGEQWQPLAQNAFIIVAAVVLVEGLSALFFGDGAGGGAGGGADG
jgi:hypothetical protein